MEKYFPLNNPISDTTFEMTLEFSSSFYSTFPFYLYNSYVVIGESILSVDDVSKDNISDIFFNGGIAYQFL